MSLNNGQEIAEIEDTMNRAIQDEFPVHFTYFKRAGFGEYRVFSPFIVDDEFGTVIGWDHRKDELRRFSLEKIAWPVEQAPDAEYIAPHEKGH